MDDDEKYEHLSKEFSRIDNQVQLDAVTNMAGDVAATVMGLKRAERILYFVMDVIAITCNAGMGAWVSYHVNDVGWIDEAVTSYVAIGYPEVGLALEGSRQSYLSENLAVEGLNYSQFSKVLWDKEIEVVRDLYLMYSSDLIK